MPVRRNPAKRSPTAREQRAFSAGFGRTFKKRTAKKSTTARRRKKPTPPPPKVSKKRESERRSKRETAFRRARTAGYGKEAAARRAMRVVPFLKSQKGRTFKGVKAYTGKATAKPLPKQYQKKTVKVKKTVTKKVPKKRKVRTAYGKYKRLRATDPRTGKKKLSYLYKTSKGKRRKIPSYAIGGASSPKRWKDPKYDKAKKRIRKRRRTAAKRTVKRGGAFTPNRRKTAMRTNKSTKRSRAAKKGWRTRRAKAAAKRSGSSRRRYRRNPTRRRTSARRATPNRRRRTRRSTALAPNRRRRRTTRRRKATPNRRRRRTTTRRRATPNRRRRRTTTTRRRRTPMRRNRRATTRRKDPKRVAAGKKAARTRARRKSAGLRRGKGSPGRYLKRGKIYYRGRKPRRLRGVKARKLPKARIYVTNRRRRRRSPVRRNRRGSYRQNQFMASLKTAATSAMFVTTGFVAHKALVHGLCDKLLLPQLQKTMSSNGNGNGNGNGATAGLRAAVPIACGGLIAAAGIWGTSKLASRQRTVEVGAGMLTSWFHTVIVKLLDLSEATRPALPYVSGYDTSSTAAAIGRYRRRRGMRGMRGLGQAGPSSSILPRYTPAMGHRAGGIRQAVAGRGTGEYFATSGMGEYFASGVQGVGQYENAGPMVTQAAAGLGQEIDNGIMPEQADQALTLAEAQAGTGASMMGARGGMGGALGEYYSARPDNGGFREYRVPTSSQWTPNNPLWAGTKPAEDSRQTSEIPAGVLESASGNGIF